MRTTLILSRGATGFMLLLNKKPYYSSDLHEVASFLLGQPIESLRENEFVSITIQTFKKKETTKEAKP